MDKWDRRIVAAVAFIIGYIVAGTAFFHYMEGWRIVDAFYFTGTTLTTVGYGDFTPTQDITKIVAVFFMFSGVGTVLYSINIVGQKFFEQRETRINEMIQTAADHGRQVRPSFVKKRIVSLKERFNDRTTRDRMISGTKTHKENTQRILKR